MIRTRVICTGVAGTPWYSNFYFAGDIPSLASQAVAKTNAYIDYIKGIVVPSITMQQDSVAVGMNPATGEIFEFFDAGGEPRVGQDTGQALPFQTQARTVFETTSVVGGRRLRGACFLGGLAESGSDSGVGPIAPFVDAIQGGYESTLGAGGGPVHLVWSKKYGVTAPVTGYRTSPVWSTLRTRRAQ